MLIIRFFDEAGRTTHTAAIRRALGTDAAKQEARMLATVRDDRFEILRDGELVASGQLPRRE